MTTRELAKMVLRNLGWTNVDAFIDSCDDAEVEETVRAATRAAGGR